MSTCPTCETKTRRKGVSVPEWKTIGPHWFCSWECVVIHNRPLVYFDNRIAPMGA